MAGEMAEAIFNGLPVPDYETLLTRESADPVFEEFGFEYGSLEEIFNHAVSVFASRPSRRALDDGGTPRASTRRPT